MSSSSQNTLGEWKLSWIYGTSPVSCRASPITAEQRVELAGLYDNVRYTLFLPSSSHITINNRIVYEGDYYRINDIRFDSSHHHLTALISQLP